MTPAATVRWITFTDADSKGMRIMADSNFLLVHSAGKQLDIQRPMPSAPLPAGNFSNGNYQYSFKVSPIVPVLSSRAKRF
jgi:hypothetical protein